MYLHALGKILQCVRCLPPKTALVMKLVLILTITACLQTTAGTKAQNITLSHKKAPLEKVLKDIRKQTAYRFVYTREELKKANPVTIDVHEKTITEVLALCFRDQPLTYSLIENFIVIMPKSTDPRAITADALIDITGQVVNQDDEPVPAATVELKISGKSTVTDEKGRFEIKAAPENERLLVSSIGYQPAEIDIDGKRDISVRLKFNINSLDETVIRGYYRITKRLNTGSVTKVTAEEISRQPVSNPLSALAGRVPGLIVTETSGVPGSGWKVQLRGQSSIGSQPGLLPFNDPLIIINGVPLAGNNDPLSTLTSARGVSGLSPLSLINPNDVESIEILKDADATAIYGSRGANGVILITTKKGINGKTKLDVNVYSGFAFINASMDLMNTAQYVAMRREAFQNDGIVPSVNNAPDLLRWDTTRYTNWKKEFIQNSASVTNAQVSLSGGNTNTQFLLGAGYNRQTTVFPGNFADNRASVNLNIHHRSDNQKFKTNISVLYSAYQSDLPVIDLTPGTKLAPNAPKLFDASGSLVWQENGVYFNNPLGVMSQPYSSNVDNLVSNIQLSYEITEGLSIRSNLGYNIISGKEVLLFPIASNNPDFQPTGSSSFSKKMTKSWIVEPQIEYQKKFGQGKISALAGITLQENVNELSSESGSGYINDAYIRSIAAAPYISANNEKVLYHYSAFFGRIGYSYADKYLLNLSGRRDGSSRFGPGKQFGNFGAIGGAWILSKEKFVTKLSFLSFAKVRASYGITGNDQIGDYRYYDLWDFTNGVPSPYQGVTGIVPTRLFNTNFSWETNKKLEVAVDVGFIQDKIMLSAAYFRNRSGNQLISYTLPIQTGFSTIDVRNFPALVQNTGLELVLSTQNISRSAWGWQTSLNITFPRNKLIAFPDIASTPYSNTLTVGQPITTVKLYRFLGVDPATGLYTVDDVNKDGIINNQDLVTGRDVTPKMYGGISNIIRYKGWELYFLVEGRKQAGINYLRSIYDENMPGFRPSSQWSNQPVVVLNRWQKQGDITNIQKLSRSGGPAFDAIPNFTSSDGIYTDASFIRLKSISINYTIPEALTKQLHLATVRLYMQGQNIFTITNYEGSDPETQNVFALPPLRIFTAGLQIGL